MLIWTMIGSIAAAPGQPRQPEHVHGNTTLEILWTVIPAVILAVIAVPTVQTIFKTQARRARRRAAGRGDRPPVVVGVPLSAVQSSRATGTNEVYLPIGRTVNFALKTQDVLHSFWIPALGGKRDLIANRTNYLWFTPDSHDRGRVQRVLCRVLRHVAREHAVPGVHGDAERVRQLGRRISSSPRRSMPPRRRRPAGAGQVQPRRRRADAAAPAGGDAPAGPPRRRRAGAGRLRRLPARPACRRTPCRNTPIPAAV